MSASTTVVFADLTGSTAVFEALGNALATEAITSLTQWIGSVCHANGGRVVKVLGDGVLALFPDAPLAITAVVQMQREHFTRLQEWPNHLRMKLQVGVASGEVVDVGGDCYGDAVNVASRLSDLSGPEQIWVSQHVIAQLRRPPPDVRFRTWLRFGGSGTEILLRREECILHTDGEIGLGAPFDDFTAPVVTFRLSGS